MSSIESQNIRKSIESNIVNLNIPVEIQRKEWESFALNVKLPENIKIESKYIENIFTEWISARNSDDKKIILYFHGGGYTTGSCITHRAIASKISLSTNKTVVLFNYSLSPENKFPQALLDSIKVYYWLYKNHTNQKNIIFGGDSSGGGLALTTILSLRDDYIPLPSSLFLISPWLDLSCKGESYISRKELDPLVAYECLKKDAHYYLTETDFKIPIISPLSMNLGNLPPMLIQVGDHEILLSDSIRLAERATNFSVRVELKVWNEMWHVWPAWDMPESDQAIIEIAEFIKSTE